MPPDRAGLRRAVIATAQRMSESGLSPGKSGNVSARCSGGMIITASGVSYKEMTPESGAVFVAADGVWTGAAAPSTEWHFHSAIYNARTDAAAIVHCHSRYATALACARKSIPAFHYMVAAAGGTDIPLAPYATFGSPELGAHVALALTNRNACLLANHGQVAIGASLEEGLTLAEEVEALAAQYTAVLAIGAPHILSDQQMADVLEKFKTYGKQRSGLRTRTVSIRDKRR